MMTAGIEFLKAETVTVIIHGLMIPFLLKTQKSIFVIRWRSFVVTLAIRLRMYSNWMISGTKFMSAISILPLRIQIIIILGFNQTNMLIQELILICFSVKKPQRAFEACWGLLFLIVAEEGNLSSRQYTLMAKQRIMHKNLELPKIILIFVPEK